MKNLILTLIVSFLAANTSAQSSLKTIYEYDKFIHLKETVFSVATVENHSKFKSVKSNLLFINTSTGEAKQIEFADGAWLSVVQQVKIDSLGINLVLVVANTVSLDNKKDIDWRDPKQIFLFSPNGDNMKQLTEENYYVTSWTINEFTGTLIVSGYFDKNRNRKKNGDEHNEILLFDLKTGTLKKSI